jgi:hypothetical protein
VGLECLRLALEMNDDRLMQGGGTFEETGGLILRADPVAYALWLPGLLDDKGVPLGVPAFRMKDACRLVWHMSPGSARHFYCDFWDVRPQAEAFALLLEEVERSLHELHEVEVPEPPLGVSVSNPGPAKDGVRP